MKIDFLYKVVTTEDIENFSNNVQEESGFVPIDSQYDLSFRHPDDRGRVYTDGEQFIVYTDKKAIIPFITVRSITYRQGYLEIESTLGDFVIN